MAGNTWPKRDTPVTRLASVIWTDIDVTADVDAQQIERVATRGLVLMEMSFKSLQLYQACFTILYSKIHGLLFSSFVGVGNLHVGYIMQQAFCAASIDTPTALGVTSR